MRSRSFLLVIFSVVCKLFVAVEQPTITLKEGLPAKIPCMVKGVADAYFWRKGENLNISDEIATIVFGVPGVVSDAFRVTEDGTLMIYNVTSAIEGRYFCRISTKDNEYYSDVLVLVQVLFDDFGFGIEQCYPKETCTLQVEPYTTTNLTCTATGVPSSISLKWYNGSDVITSVASEHSSNEESSTVSETITVRNEFGLPLTCEAVASEDGQACARLAHVRLDKTDTAKEQTDADKSSARWIALLVLLIFVSGFTVFLLVYIYASKNKYVQKKKRTGQQEVLLDEKDTLLELKDGELRTLQEKLKLKDGELRTLQEKLKPKDGELRTLQDKFKPKDGELRILQDKFKLKDGELTDLQDKFKLKDGELRTLQDKFKLKDGELRTLQDKFKEANEELKKVREDLSTKNTTLTKTAGELEQVKKDLTENKKKLTKTTGELERVKKDLTENKTKLTKTTGGLEQVKKDLTENKKKLTKANEDLENAKKDLSAKNTTLTKTTGELEQVKKDLTENKEKLTKTTGELEQVKKDLTENKEKLTKANEELENAKKDLSAKNSTPTDAEGQ